jgi:alginate O-acetyltransferase complex protein AlgJ
MPIKTNLCRPVIYFSLLLAMTTAGYPAPLKTEADSPVILINGKYNRTKSLALIRRITTPTRANLDQAAYSGNVILFDTTRFKTVPPTGITKLADLDFNGTLEKTTICDRLDQVPVPPKTKASPISWPALRQYLLNWDFEKSQGIIEALNRISEEKWANDEVYQPLQEAASLYLNEASPGIWEMWAMVEFKPSARLFKFVKDDDNDGFPELFGRLPAPAIAPVIKQITEQYIRVQLTQEEVVTWANELASFWYPSYNTDISRSPLNVQWPNAETEPAVKKELGALTVKSPAVIIKGTPFGYAMYNVFLVDGMTNPEEQKTVSAAVTAVSSGPGDKAAKKENLEKAIRIFNDELAKYGGGDYTAWSGNFQKWYSDIKAILASEPAAVNGFPGQQGFLFFRNSLNYLVGGDLQKQPAGKNPLPSIAAFAQMLEGMGIDFLFIPVPVKPEVYPEMVGPAVPQEKGPYVNPFERKFLKELCEAGVEIIDLLPLMLAEKDRTAAPAEPIFQKQDTHWTTRGLELAAQAIAERIKKYSWYQDVPKLAYTVKDTTFTSMGDVVSRLKQTEQAKYKPQTLTGRQVVSPAGTFYEDQKNSPIFVIGDSFTGVYELTGCKYAGVSAHLAKNIGFPVQLFVSYGGGPTVVSKMKQMGKKELQGKKLVIWMMVARDLYNYWDDWTVLKTLE